MATTKKASVKKAPAKKPVAKKAPVKKAAAKTAPVKATAKKRTVTKKNAAAKAARVRSFRISRSDVPFSTFKITRQTVYWIILVAFIIFVQLWILKIQMDIATLLEAQQADLMIDDSL